MRTSLMRFDPFRHRFSGLLEEMERLMGDRPALSDEESMTSAWTPTVDVLETDGAITLRAELPGMTADDVEILVENGQLVVKGEKVLEKTDEKQGQWRRVESRYGSFYRSFPLPPTVDLEDVDAHFENGVLQVTLPKAEEAKTRHIRVKQTM